MPTIEVTLTTQELEYMQLLHAWNKREGEIRRLEIALNTLRAKQGRLTREIVRSPFYKHQDTAAPVTATPEPSEDDAPDGNPATPVPIAARP